VWIRELIVTRDAGGQTYTVIKPERFHALPGVDLGDRGGYRRASISEWRIDSPPPPGDGPPAARCSAVTIAGLLKRLTAAAERHAEAS